MEDTFTGGDIAAAAASEAPPASQPSGAETTTTSASADATSPHVGQTTPEVTSSTTQTPGIPPEHRWPTILENQRREAAEQAEAKWKQQYGWAETVDRQAVEQAARIGQMYAQDRAGYVRQMLAEAASDPELAPMVRSEAARLLSGGRQAQAAPDLSPIQVQMENGQTVGLYTDQQVTAAIQQAMQGMEQKLAPLQQTHEQIVKAQAHMELMHEANRFAEGFGKDLQKLPHFAEHKAEIVSRLSQMRLGSDHPAEVRAATFQIYHDVVLPKLATAERRAVLHDINQKASVSGVTPNAQSSSAPKEMKDMSWADALKAGFAAAKG